MANKRPSLTSLRSIAKGEPPQPAQNKPSPKDTSTAEVAAASKEGARKPPPPSEPAPPRTPRQASRQGLKSVTFYVSEEAHEVLAIMAIKKRRTQESLLKEALNDLLAKYGENPIA